MRTTPATTPDLRLKRCLREPLELHFWVAFKLAEAVTAHNSGDLDRAAELFVETDRDELRVFLNTLWGAYSQYNSPINGQRNPRSHSASKSDRTKIRMPNAATQKLILDRDGYSCRYCSIPLIPPKTRQAVHRNYPNEVPWGRKEHEQHAAFQSLWLQYDHVVPHSMNGTNDIDNIVTCCAGCNFGKSNHSLEQLGLSDPFERPPIVSGWNGLTHFEESDLS